MPGYESHGSAGASCSVPCSPGSSTATTATTGEATTVASFDGAVDSQKVIVCAHRPPLTLAEVEQWFHLPLREATRHLGLGTTQLKMACRRFGTPHPVLLDGGRRMRERELTEQTGDG